MKKYNTHKKKKLKKKFKKIITKNNTNVNLKFYVRNSKKV
jgi:hypothetical protein